MATIKTNGKGGQHNSYTFFPGGKHTHTWYDPKTAQMGFHGENTSSSIKKATGQAATASTNGNWLKGIKGR